MSIETGIRMKNPPHPGRFIKSEILEPLELNVTEAAAALGVGRPALSNFLNSKAALSPEMAIRIAKAFGLSMETLMRMQNSYDIAQARIQADSIDVKPYKPQASHQQLGMM